MERHPRAQPAQAQHGPEMRRQGHVAIPGKAGAIEAAERHAVKPEIGHRHRLHRDGEAGRAFGDGEERGFERQQALAVAAGALGKEDQILAGLEPRRNRVALSVDRGAAPVDEDAALQLGQGSDCLLYTSRCV